MIDVSEVREQRSSIVGGISTSKSNSDMPEEVLEIPQGVLVYEIEGPNFTNA